MNIIELAGNEGWWTDPDAVDYAYQWLETFQQECGEKWIEPVGAECVVFDDQDISIEWKHSNKIITIIINPEEAYCGQSHESTGRHDAFQFANTPEERAAIWSWLTDEEKRP